MPIPALNKTFKQYLEGMKCVLPHTEYQKTKENVKLFLAFTESKHLQRLLQTYAFQKENWVRKEFCHWDYLVGFWKNKFQIFFH